VIYFASGASAPSDLRGLARIRHDLGVSLPELSEPALQELLTLAGATCPAEDGSLSPRPLCVLADTGAFSEVDIVEGRPVVTHPIDEAGWGERMRVMLRIGRALRGQAYCVAPDCVGDQTETLARLRRWARWVRKLRRLGARVLVPIQQGAMVPATFDRAVAEVLGFTDYVRAIPSNKDAMPDAVLESFVRATRPRAVHLLGVGPRNPRLRTLRAILDRLVPGAEISCDSNLLAAHVGHTNGPGGGPRSLTAAQEGRLLLDATTGQPSPMSREDAIVMALGPALFFERWARHLATRGIYFDGFERVGDGLWPRGFVQVVPPAARQLGLFDRADAAE
jgi:hypothetical protein